MRKRLTYPQLYRMLGAGIDKTLQELRFEKKNESVKGKEQALFPKRRSFSSEEFGVSAYNARWNSPLVIPYREF